mmetsp:Transcript_81497/g.235500  ORF Transcript_81497/g.235500 Transcript_81497/m.235500 type:complete len:343 (-) Transcript_81497:615-1643(-)
MPADLDLPSALNVERQRAPERQLERQFFSASPPSRIGVADGADESNDERRDRSNRRSRDVKGCPTRQGTHCPQEARAWGARVRVVAVPAESGDPRGRLAELLEGLGAGGHLPVVNPTSEGAARGVPDLQNYHARERRPVGRLPTETERQGQRLHGTCVVAAEEHETRDLGFLPRRSFRRVEDFGREGAEGAAAHHGSEVARARLVQRLPHTPQQRGVVAEEVRRNGEVPRRERHGRANAGHEAVHQVRQPPSALLGVHPARRQLPAQGQHLLRRRLRQVLEVSLHTPSGGGAHGGVDGHGLLVGAAGADGLHGVLLCEGQRLGVELRVQARQQSHGRLHRPG